MSRHPITRRQPSHGDQEGPSLARVASPLLTRASRIGLWALVVLGACGGVVAAVRPTAPPQNPTPRFEPVAVPAEVAGVAELAVRRFLTTGTPDETTDRTTPASSTAGEGAPFDVVATATVASRRLDHGYWAVTVAAHVREAAPPSTSSAVWFLEVGVVAAPDGHTVTGPPAVVPGPNDMTVRLAGPALAPPRPGDPLAETAASFLRALLTGAGDITRYLAPGVTVTPTSPPPFTAITVTRTATVSATTAQTVLRVEASAVTPAERELVIVYELTLTERDGRWEVRSLSGAPTLRPSESPDRPAPTTTTTSTTGTTVPSPPTPGG